MRLQSVCVSVCVCALASPIDGTFGPFVWWGEGEGIHGHCRLVLYSLLLHTHTHLSIYPSYSFVVSSHICIKNVCVFSAQEPMCHVYLHSHTHTHTHTVPTWVKKRQRVVKRWANTTTLMVSDQFTIDHCSYLLPTSFSAHSLSPCFCLQECKVQALSHTSTQLTGTNSTLIKCAKMWIQIHLHPCFGIGALCFGYWCFYYYSRCFSLTTMHSFGLLLLVTRSLPITIIISLGSCFCACVPVRLSAVSLSRRQSVRSVTNWLTTSEC